MTRLGQQHQRPSQPSTSGGSSGGGGGVVSNRRPVLEVVPEVRKRSTQGSNDASTATAAGESGHHQTKKMKIELKQEDTSEEDTQMPSTSREPAATGTAVTEQQPKRQTEEEKRVEPKREPGTSSASLPRRERDVRTPSPQPGPSTAADLPTPAEAQEGFRDGAPMGADDLHLDCLSSDTEPEDEDEDVTVVTIARSAIFKADIPGNLHFP